jgi:hypothetical protein
MYVLQVPLRICAIPHPMIGKAALPDLLVFPECNSEGMRVSTLNELHGAFESHFIRWRKQQMHVFRHQDKGM